MRISLAAGKPPAYREAIIEGVYQAMRSTFNVPADDRFAVIHEHAPGSFSADPGYLGIERTADAVIIQITCNAGRTTDMKRALYAGIVERLHADPGIRTEDVFINLVEVLPENWSFGNGIAQYAK